MVIEEVSRRRRTDAIRFLAGGGCRDPIAEARAQALKQLIAHRGRENVRLWWARRKRWCVGAALIIESPGKTGVLFHTSANADGAEADCLVQLVRAMCSHTIGQGLSMVQTLLETDANQDVEMLKKAGFVKLARLVYMKLDLAAAPTYQADASIAWRNYAELAEEELAEVIRRTYEGSLDCPGLSGVRKIEDVVAGHKASGVFCPQAWWLIERDSSLAGCILVNDSPTVPISEIVYVGVVGGHRGHGLGRVMLRRAAAEAHGRGSKAIRLAVDGRNHYAIRLYEAEGYRRTHCRLAYMMCRRDLPRAADVSDL